MKKQAYHHHDLRAALLEAAGKILVEEGVEKVTMRALSRKIGVSHSAPYRHFADKTELLCALAEEGFVRLRGHIQEANADRSVGALARFKAMTLAYIDFAVRNEAYYRLMFETPAIVQARHAGLRTAAQAAFGDALDVLEECRPEGTIRPTDTSSVAHAVWATVHGLSILLIDGQIEAEADGRGSHAILIEEGMRASGGPPALVQSAIDTLIAGIHATGSARTQRRTAHEDQAAPRQKRRSS